MRALPRAALGGLALAALLLSAAGSGAAPDGLIRVGSKSFTESYILAEIVAQIIEQVGEARVERRVGLGGTGLTYRALESGAIDLYPEYTGHARARPPEGRLARDTGGHTRAPRAERAHGQRLARLRQYLCARGPRRRGGAPRPADDRRSGAASGAAGRVQLGLSRARGRLARPARALRPDAGPDRGDGARAHLSRDRERAGGRHGRLLHRRPARAAEAAAARRRPALLPGLLRGAPGAPGDDRALPAHLGAAARGARGPARRRAHGAAERDGGPGRPARLRGGRGVPGRRRPRGRADATGRCWPSSARSRWTICCWC